jgi:predicted ATPase
LFGIDLPAHPSWDEVQGAYETIWRNLNGRSIECLIDLPLMTDAEMQAAMQVFSSLAEVGYFTDFYLYCMLVCRMANISMQHGMSGASAHAYACLGSILGPVFHRYREGYRLGRLACDLVEKHDFTAYRTKATTPRLWRQRARRNWYFVGKPSDLFARLLLLHRAGGGGALRERFR